MTRINASLFGEKTTPCNTVAEIASIMAIAASFFLICKHYHNNTVVICATVCLLASCLALNALGSYKNENAATEKSLDELIAAVEDTTRKVTTSVENINDEHKKSLESLQKLSEALKTLEKN